MFTNIGNKIKVLAEVFCWIGISASLIVGFVLIGTNDALIGIGLGVMVIGSLLSWISSFALYGFGELIDQMQEINSKLSGEPNNYSGTNSKRINPTVGKEEKHYKSEKGTCELCEKQDVDVIKCKIVDSLGTRYRKICPDCMKSKNATPTDY
ncbi:MAG: hypothetical protein IJJ40_04455 [Clostridia bacterium]|nr:hypothetical protein [Clostridia bacterium]